VTLSWLNIPSHQDLPTRTQNSPDGTYKALTPGEAHSGSAITIGQHTLRNEQAYERVHHGQLCESEARRFRWRFRGCPRDLERTPCRHPCWTENL